MTLLSFKEKMLSEESKKRSTGGNTPYKVIVTKDQEINSREDRDYEAWFHSSSGEKIEISIQGQGDLATIDFLRNGVVAKTFSDLEDWKNVIATLVKSIKGYLEKYKRFGKVDFRISESDSKIITAYEVGFKEVSRSLGYSFTSKKNYIGLRKE